MMLSVLNKNIIEFGLPLVFSRNIPVKTSRPTRIRRAIYQNGGAVLPR